MCIYRKSGAYLDPCLPTECTEHGTYKGKKYSFLGTGEYVKCQQLILPLLNLTRPCPKKPCSFNAVYQPRLDYEKVEFYGFSEYWYSMHDVLRIGGQYSARNMKKAVEVRFSTLRLLTKCLFCVQSCTGKKETASTPSSLIFSRYGARAARA